MIILEYLRVHGVAYYLAHVSFQAEVLLKSFLDVVKVFRLQKFSRSYCDRSLSLENHLLKVFRESALWLSHHSLKVGNHGVREVHVAASFHDVFRSKVVLNHEYGHVAYHL